MSQYFVDAISLASPPPPIYQVFVDAIPRLDPQKALWALEMLEEMQYLPIETGSLGNDRPSLGQVLLPQDVGKLAGGRGPFGLSDNPCDLRAED